MLLLLVITFCLSVALCLPLVIRGTSLAQSYGHDMPQRFHAGHVPRWGGGAALLASVLGWLIAWVLAQLGAPNQVPVDAKYLLVLMAICLPASLAGLMDDLTQKVSARWRLLASSASAALACWLLGLSVVKLDVPWIDSLWMTWPWLGVALAFTGLAGLPHAFNIIDGYNGLAGMVSVMICAALAYIALQFGDRALAGVLICVIGATLGFLFWNYPRGLIFAGDGGAYFWGVIIAVTSISLVQRHPQVSPWFVMLLLIYPVWETMFSIYRKLIRGQSPGAADSMHFHQLVYKRIVRGVFHDDATRQMLMRNNRTSPYIWAFTGLTVAPAVLFWYSTPILIFFCCMFIVTYIAAYLMIVRFKVSRWLRFLAYQRNKKPPV
jgi:UDP-GlcNAc:undecaprenyl-phosphate/decaprenyl-phosphate GlcNAc-1-phosphate transferase